MLSIGAREMGYLFPMRNVATPNVKYLFNQGWNFEQIMMNLSIK